MSAYEIVDVVPDTPQWEQERRRTLGASEVAAVLGISPFGETPRSVYRAKRGMARDFDQELSFIGHEEERTMQAWLERFHPEVGQILPAVMYRSTEYPWLHASLDRRASKGGLVVPVQMKTTAHWAGKEWEDGIPDWVVVQVQTELIVTGAPWAWVVAFVGGRRFHLFRVDPDLAVQEQIIRITRDFWFNHVVAGVEPDATTVPELDESKVNTGEVFDTDDERVLMAWYLDGLERAAFKTADENVDAVKAAYKQLLLEQKADTLSYKGKPLYTWKRSKDVVTFDRQAFELDHPDLVAKYTRIIPGSPRFLRKTVKEFESDPPEGWQPGLTVGEVLAEQTDLTVWRTVKGAAA